MRHNRRVYKDLLNAEGDTPYALSEKAIREAVVLYNKDTMKSAE